MYKVLRPFTDRFDGGRHYKIGETYPREGFAPPAGRPEALASAERSSLNTVGTAFIEPIETDEERTAREERERAERETALKVERAAALSEKLDKLDVEQMKAYADEHKIDIGRATSLDGIREKIVTAEQPKE